MNFRAVRLRGFHASSGLHFDADRWNRFLHSRLWPGAPGAGAAAFVALFLLRRFGEGLPTGDAALKAALCAVAIVVCWGIGIWGAVRSPHAPEGNARACPDERIRSKNISGGIEPDKGPGTVRAEQSSGTHAPGPSRKKVTVVVALFILLITALLGFPQIEGMATGDMTLARGFGGLLLKLMAVTAVLLPMGFAERRE